MKELEYHKLPNEEIIHDDIKVSSSYKPTLNLRKKFIIILIVLGLIALVLLCFVVFFNNKVKEDKSSVAQPQSNSQDLPLAMGNSTADSSLPAEPTPVPTPTPVPIPKDEWFLRLVNKENALPDDFDPDTEQVYPGYHFDTRAAADLKQMITDGNAQGLKLMVISGFRSFKRQDALFLNKVREFTTQGESREQAEISAQKTVAKSGMSEHNLGLGVDIVSRDNQRMQADYVDTPEYKWLIENAHLYGFILRYPEDKTEATGFDFEPWHFRFVGKEQANLIKESGLCLEEYLAQ